LNVATLVYKVIVPTNQSFSVSAQLDSKIEKKLMVKSQVPSLGGHIVFICKCWSVIDVDVDVE